MDTQSLTGWLSIDEIESPLRRMIGSDLQISDKWVVDQFKRGQGDGLGTWRVAGRMTTPQGERSWSMVLKGWDCSDKSGCPSAFDWPWREADLYGSGVLNDLPGVHAPTCFGTVERGDSVWVWLGDLTGVPQPKWNLENYAKAARMLGRFNGAYLAGRPLPANRSLSKDWLAGLTATSTETMATLDQYLHHPFVKKMLPPDVKSAYFRIWDQRHAVLDRLSAMPQTFCHLDAFHQNTFFLSRNGDEEMVLIDWAFAGQAALGEELVSLCVAGVLFDPDSFSNLHEIERVAFNGYVAGLRDTGWDGSKSEIWWAYRSAAVLRYGPAIMRPLIPVIMNEDSSRAMAEAMNVPFDDIQDHVARLSHWIADHADSL